MTLQRIRQRHANGQFMRQPGEFRACRRFQLAPDGADRIADRNADPHGPDDHRQRVGKLLEQFVPPAPSRTSRKSYGSAGSIPPASASQTMVPANPLAILADATAAVSAAISAAHQRTR